MKVSEFLRELDRHQARFGDIVIQDGTPAARSASADTYYILDAALRERDGLFSMGNYEYMQLKYGYENARDIINALRRPRNSSRSRWIRKLIDARISRYKAGVRPGELEERCV